MRNTVYRVTVCSRDKIWHFFDMFSMKFVEELWRDPFDTELIKKRNKIILDP